MRTKQFWLETGERAVKTFAQSAVALLTAGAAGLLGVDWLQLVSVAGLAALVSVLTSVGSDYVGDRGTASLVTYEDDSAV
ncbi:holin [Leucobacter coleopterorum]|uniref:Holin n=1 Tax=Leucobacter coleopterorum TaxID=2714933 RepID=A0ABX6JYR3_9MICO|nr:holin [Leucobacter coleopterorum]QIM19465.1 holin [Leucobacter coleopterorum]